MHCPVDGTTLLMSERQDVEIDYCPECRGVWLDRGELDKLVRRSESDDRDRDRDRDRRSRDRDDDDHRYPKHKKKKSSWLSEVFELGG